MTNDDRDELIRETHGAVIKIQADCETCRPMVQLHDTALRGNGKPGLAVRVGKLEMVVCSMGGGAVVMIFGGLIAWGFGKL